MGSRLVKIDFKSGENEQIKTMIKIPKEKRSIVYGMVIDYNGQIAKDAVVKLFEVTNQPNKLKPLTHTFTDEQGQFLFGPINANKKYVIKVWYDNVKTKQITVTPDDINDTSEDNINNEKIGTNINDDNNLELSSNKPKKVNKYSSKKINEFKEKLYDIDDYSPYGDFELDFD